MRISIKFIAFLLMQTIVTSCKDQIKLKATFVNSPPQLQMSGEGENFTVKGFGFDVLSLLGDVLNIEFEYVPLAPSALKQYGLVQAIIDHLVNKETDVVPITLINTFERNQIIDVTYPVVFEDFYILYAKPEEENSLLLVIKPFHYEVWLSLAIFTAGVRALIILTHILDQKINNNFNEGLQISYATITNNAGVDRHRYLLKFLLLGTWGLMMTIVYNAYTTTITSFLTIPRLKPLPDNLEELAKEPSFKLTLEWDHLKTQTFLNATSGPMKKLGDSLRQNKHLLTKTSAEATDNVLKNGNVFIGAGGYIFYTIGKDMLANGGKCRYALSRPLQMTDAYGYGLQKKGKYNAILQRKLLHIAESRIVSDHLYHKHLFDIDRCIKGKKKSTKKLEKLELKDLSGAFLILLVGALVSFLVFLTENIISAMQKK